MTSPEEPDPGGASYQPPYPYPGPAGYPPPYPYYPPPTSGWAIAAFVLGLVSCVPLGLILGIIALVKTRGGSQRGRELAIAAIVISALWTALWTVAGGVGLHVLHHPTTFLVLGTTQSGGSAQFGQLLYVGQCANETPQGTSQGAWDGGIQPVVGCDQPHSDEVFAILSLSYFPGGDADKNEILAHCKSELQKYSPSAGRDPKVQIVLDMPGTSWKYMDNHTAACLAHFSSNRVGSIRG
jgi:Domain of unknown function (DUF4190)